MAAPSLGSGKRVYLGHLPSNLVLPSQLSQLSSSLPSRHPQLSPLNCVLALTVFM